MKEKNPQTPQIKHVSQFFLAFLSSCDTKNDLLSLNINFIQRDAVF